MMGRVLSFFLLFLLVQVGLAIIDPPSSDYTCSPSKPCKIGCCGNSGVCGLGPTFCGAGNCTSSCDAKSDCDPGWGSQWSAKEKCPLNVCCSKFGFCGTTPEFCGTSKVKSPSCSGGQTVHNRVIGYYEGWSATRACDGQFPEDLPAWGYSHLNYAFAFVDPHSFKVAPMQQSDLDLMPRFTALKQQYPGLQTWISIGGWSMNDPDQPTATTFSDLAGSSSAQSAFFSSLLSFMTTYGFDGVDIDWEYPVAPERSGKPADYANYVSFLQNLRNALGAGGHNYGLTLTLPSSYWYLQNFDIVKIEPIVDWFNVMTYDLHGTWDSTDVWIGPYVYAHTNLTEIDQTMQLFWRNNISPSKITLGMGFYGRSFTLTDPGCSGPGCPFTAGGKPGPCTASAGTLSFSEINDIIAAGATVKTDKDAAVKLVTWGGDQWVSYDDEDTFKMKIDYANDKCLGGMMVWAASLDDGIGTATSALSGASGRDKFPLSLKTNVQDSISRCIWGECGQNCPAGTSPAQRSDGHNRGNVGIYNGCSNGKTRNFCCPSNDMPTCQWRGTAPLCSDSGAACKKGEVAVASDDCGTGKCCWFRHKNLCCSSSASDSGFGSCQWHGSGPTCAVSDLGAADCPKDQPNVLTYDKDGAGGEAVCYIGYKTYCCSDPNPFQNCGWWNAGQNYSYWPPLVKGFGYNCDGKCPPGQTPIAAESAECKGGTQAYFCCDSADAKANPNLPDANICALSSGLFGESGDPDDFANFDIEYDDDADHDDCYVPGEPGSGDTNIFRRGWDDLEVVSINGSLHRLEKRGNPRSFKVCLATIANGVRSGISAFFKSLGYPKASQLRSIATYVFRTNQLACDDGSVSTTTLANGIPTGVKWVVEHPYELNTPSKLVQSMIDGVYPSVQGTVAKIAGGPLNPQAAQQLFDTNGLWFSTPSFTNGLSINDYIYNTLGSSVNKAHFLIVQSEVNTRKMVWWMGKSAVDVAKIAKKAPQAQLAAFQDVVASFNYVNTPEAQAALQGIRSDYLAAWKNVGNYFNNYLASQGLPQYDFAGVARNFDTANVAMQVNTVRSFIPGAVADRISFLQSAAGIKAVPLAATRQSFINALNDIQNNLINWCKFDNTWISGSGG